MSVILKTKHSLIGKSLIPVVLSVKNLNEPIPEKDLARLKKDHSLAGYSWDELIGHFEGLTGETARDILPMTGKDETLENLRILMHFVILHANQVGAPKAQPLKDITAAGPSQGGQNGATVPAVTHSDHDQGTDSSQSSLSLEDRLKAIEKKVTSVAERSAEGQVEDCLKNVRILASRPSLTQPHVLLAALETLVGVAVKVSHKDSEYFSKAYVHCKKYEDTKDLCGLTMKLFGTAEDKKIATVVADWVKSKKYEEPSKKDVPSNTENSKSSQGMNTNFWQVSSQPPMFNYPYMTGAAQFPHAFPYPPQNFSAFSRPFGRGRRGTRGRCLYCRDIGHFVAECPKIKKE